MKVHVFFAAPLFFLAACASTPTPYGPAATPDGKGFSELRIEDTRYRVSYSGDDAAQARDFALLRAAELTLEQGFDWFRLTNAFTEVEGEYGRRGGSTSVSVGGSSGSYGSGVGVGVGIGLPLGGGSTRDAVHDIEILLGAGEKPDDPNVYDARAVQASLLGAPAP